MSVRTGVDARLRRLLLAGAAAPRAQTVLRLRGLRALPRRTLRVGGQPLPILQVRAAPRACARAVRMAYAPPPQEDSRVFQSANSLSGCVWASTFPLVLLLERVAPWLRAHTRDGAAVVDLGCGVGAGALAAALCGAHHVVASDVDGVPARANVEALLEAAPPADERSVDAWTAAARVRVIEHDWHSPPEALAAAVERPCALVLAGDVLYFSEHVAALAHTLDGLARAAAPLRTVVAVRARWAAA